VIFGSSGGNRGSGGNTSAFTSRNSNTPVFTTLGAFTNTIPVRSSRGIGCYRGEGGRGGGGGGIIGGSGRGIVGRGYRRLFSIVVIKTNRISPFTRSTSALSISSYIYIYDSFSLIIAIKV